MIPKQFCQSWRVAIFIACRCPIGHVAKTGSESNISKERTFRICTNLCIASGPPICAYSLHIASGVTGLGIFFHIASGRKNLRISFAYHIGPTDSCIFFTYRLGHPRSAFFAYRLGPFRLMCFCTSRAWCLLRAIYFVGQRIPVASQARSPRGAGSARECQALRCCRIAWVRFGSGGLESAPSFGSGAGRSSTMRGRATKSRTHTSGSRML